MQFKGSHGQLKKSERKDIRDVLSRAKSYEDLDEFVGGMWNGEDEMKEIVRCIESRPSRATEEKGKNLVDLAKLLTASIARHAQPKNAEATGGASSKPQESSSGGLPSSAVNPIDGTNVEDDDATPDDDAALSTPPDRVNPEPDALKTPRLPLNDKLMPIPAMISGRDAPTPTPTPPTSQGAGSMLA
jgi:tRNA-dihydrouridine synthase 2